MTTVEQHVSAFRRAASAAGDLSDIKKQNRSADETHLHAVALRETADGRLALEGLMNDADPFVRVWAATDVLAWKPDAATKALEELVASDGPGAFEAKWTLIEFRRGELKLDY